MDKLPSGTRLKVRIKANIADKYSFPHWPWYLGSYVKGVYIPGYEGQEFEVYIDQYYSDRYTVASLEWSFNHMGSKTAWISFDDAEPIPMTIHQLKK